MDAKHRAENLRRSAAMAPLAAADQAWLAEHEAENHTPDAEEPRP